MANDTELFLSGFEDDEFAGASVTAKSPEYDEKLLQQLGSLPPEYGMNVDASQELLDAPVDAEINIVRDSDTDLFLSGFEDTIEYKPSTTSASFTGGDKGASDFTKAIAGSILGSKQFFLDILDGIGFEPTSEMSQENIAKIQHIKSMVQDDSLFSSYGMGQAVYSIATLPIAARRIATAALAEAYMGYSISRGSGAEVGTSIASGVAAGTITYGVGKLLNNLGGTTALEAIEGSVGRKMDLLTVYSDFARLTNRKVEDLTNHDKVLAIASTGGKETAQIFKEMALRNHADGRVIDDYLQKPVDELKEKVAANSLAKTKEALQGQIAFAKSAYNELENLAMVYPTANINLGPARQSIIDNILTSTNDITRSPKLNKALTTLQKENINLEELLDLRKDLNGVKFKAQNLNSKTRNEVDAVNYIDSVIDKNLPTEFKPAFTALREELAMAYSFAGKQKKAEYKNKIAELVTKIDSGEETAVAVLQKLVKASGGPNKFNQIHRGIGTEEAINFEKSLIKEIMAAKGDKLAEVIKVTNGLGFVTPEAKAIVKNIQDIDKVFSSADFYRATLSEIHHGGLDGTSITNDVTTKFSYMATAGVWKVLRPYLDPISQTARSEREFRRIIDSIRKGIKADTSKTKLDGPTEEMYSVFRPIIRESIVGTIQDTLNTIRGMSGARVPEGQATNLLDAPADFTVRADGTTIRQSGDAAQEALSREPINTTIVDEANTPLTSVKPSEDIIDVEWWNPTSTVITPDGHILSMEELLRAESLPDNMRLPEKASAPIKSFFDMKYKMKTDPDLIKAREEVKKATTKPAKEKAKGRLLKQLEYQRLRDQGVKPSEAHRLAMQSSSEVGGALAGGTINGVTIDDNGNLQVDPEAFLIGAAGGAVAVKGGKALVKYIDEGNELMMQQAGGGTPPSSGKIDLNYKLTSVLNSIDDRQKFTTNQLFNYLKGKGVSENEMRVSGILDTNEGLLTAKEWKQRDIGAQQFKKTVYKGDDADFSYITLGQRGADSDTYKVNEWMANKDKNMPNTNLRHKMDNNSYTTQDYDNMSQLGWNRIHLDTIKGQDVTVLNELQSDWMQAERQGAGFFKAKTEKLKQEYYKQKAAYEDFYTNTNNDGKEPPISRQALSELYDRVVKANNAPEIRDFPMRPEKFQQFMIIDALNEAIQNGTNKVVVPIEREGADLEGNEGLTQFYKSLDKQLDIIAKNLENQGVMVRRRTEKYDSGQVFLKVGDLDIYADELSERGVDKSVWSILYDYPNSSAANFISNLRQMGADEKQVRLVSDYFDEYFPVEQNTLYTIEVKMPKAQKVSWDVYSIIGALGLTGLAEKLKESNTGK